MFPVNQSESYHILSVMELQWNPRRAYTRGRGFYALSFRVEGDVVFQHDKQAHPVSTNQIAFVPKAFDYTMHARTREHVFVVHFEMQPDIPMDFASFTPADPTYYREQLKLLHRIWKRKQTGYQYAAASVFYGILEQLAKENVQKENPATTDKLSETLEYIHRHYADPGLNVAALAELYGTSTTYFRRIFKQTCGMLPLQYIHDLRLKRAEELMLSGYYTVAEVAYATGFTDPKYFSRFFKKEKGYTPSEIAGNTLEQTGSLSVPQE